MFNFQNFVIVAENPLELTKLIKKSNNLQYQKLYKINAVPLLPPIDYTYFMVSYSYMVSISP